MSLFDLLPLEDVIHEILFPMLDYESRINLNRCFIPSERYYSRFTNTDMITHDLYVSSNHVRHTFAMFDEVSDIDSSQKRIQMRSQLMVKILNMFRPRGRGISLMIYYPQFRETVLQKFMSVLDPESDTLTHATMYFKKKLRTISRELLPYLQNITHTPLQLSTKVYPIHANGFLPKTKSSLS